MQPTYFLRSVALAAALAGTAHTQCWQLANAVPGMDLQLTDESNRTVALPFAFPFANQTYDHITVNSNGFLWLGLSDETDFFPDAFTAIGGAPRIMPSWWDLDPGAGGQVTYAASLTSVSICWKNVPEFQAAAVADFECILESSGVIHFHYGAGNGNPLFSDLLIGITAGRGAAANNRVWTTDIANTAILGSATGMQFVPFGTANPLNTGGALTLLPANPQATDYIVFAQALPNCSPTTWPTMFAGSDAAYGAGCPAPLPGGAIYQWFAATSFDLANTSVRFVRAGGAYSLAAGPAFDPTYAATGQMLPMGDDTLVTGIGVGPMAAFPFGHRTITQVSVCSNGFLWLGDDQRADFSESTAEFLAEGQRIAPLWTDLNVDPTSQPPGNGAVWIENTGAVVRCTWAGVAEFGFPASSNTFQVTLFPNGDIAFAYAAMTASTSGTTPIVGITDGGGLADPGSFDLATAGTVNALSRTISGVAAAGLTVGPALIGGSFAMHAQVPAPQLGITAFGVSYAQVVPGLPLAGLGGPGCFLHIGNFDYLFLNPTPGNIVTETQSVPNNALLLGLQLFAQVGCQTTGNSLGFYTSNAVAFTIGNAY